MEIKTVVTADSK